MRDYRETFVGLRGAAKGLREINMPRTAKQMEDAADAIEELLAAVHSVVHCKDCKWCHAGYCEKYDDLIPWGCANKPWEDWFCADGKRPEPPKEVE